MEYPAKVLLVVALQETGGDVAGLVVICCWVEVL